MGIPGPPSGKPRILSVPKVIRTSAFFRRSTPAPPRTIRASLLIDERPIHLGSRPARDNQWVDPTGADLASSRRAVSHSARRSLALPFLFAIFRRQFPPAEPSLLNHYHLSWFFEVSRDHHLRPLAEVNRQ